MGTGVSLLGGILNGLGDNTQQAREAEVSKERETAKNRVSLLTQLAGQLDPNSPTHAQDIAQILQWAQNPLQDKQKKSKTAGPSGAKIDPDEHIGHMSTLIAGLNKTLHALGHGAKAVGEHVGPFYQAARPATELDPQQIQKMIGTPEQREQWKQEAEMREVKSKLATYGIVADVLFGKETPQNKDERTAFLRESITGKAPSAAARPIRLGDELIDPNTRQVIARNPTEKAPKNISQEEAYDLVTADKLKRYDKDGKPDPSKLSPEERVDGRNSLSKKRAQEIKVTVNGGGSGTSIPEEDLRALAQREIETGQKPSFGLSAKDPNRAKYNRILAETWRGDPNNKTALASYKAGSANLAQLTKVGGIVGTLEDAFKLDIQNAREASAAVPRSSMAKFNKLSQFLQADFTDNPELAKYQVAVQTAINQYARIMSTGSRGAGTTSVSAQQHAEQLLNAAMPKGALDGALDQMSKEASNVATGIDEQIAKQREGLQSGGKTASPTSSKSGAPPKTADDYLKSIGISK